MNSLIADNSSDAEFQRAVIWQYDHATKLTSLILSFKDFFNKSTKSIWDRISSNSGLAVYNGENEITPADTDIDEYMLALQGKLLGISRPRIKYESSSGGTTTITYRPMSKQLYRKILIARWRLANGNASIGSYNTFVSYIFGSNVSVSGGDDMSLTFSWVATGTLTEEQQEQKNTIEQFGDMVFAYPAGVKSHDLSDDAVFGFSEQAGIAVSGTSITASITNVTGSAVTINVNSYILVNDTKFIISTSTSIASNVSVELELSNSTVTPVQEKKSYDVYDSSDVKITSVRAVVKRIEYTRSGVLAGKKSFITVRIFGSVGTTIPTASKLFKGTGSSVESTAFSTSIEYSISTEGFVDAIFEYVIDDTSAPYDYIKCYTSVSVTDSSGTAISGISRAITVTRSLKDFSLSNFDKSSFAWKR